MSELEHRLLHALEGVQVLIADVCPVCGSHQRIKETGECFACHLTEMVGVPFDELKSEVFANFVNAYNLHMLDLSKYHHDGRLGAEQLRDAAQKNLPYYYGAACRECGCNLRATVNGECESCGALEFRFSQSRGEPRPLSLYRSRRILRGNVVPVLTMKVDRIVRSVAKEMGAKFYHGYPCECGDNKRYTARGQCVSCVDERNARYRSNKGMTPRKKKPAAVETEADFSRLFD